MATIVFIWDNFGPMHDDRVREVARAYRGNARIVGIEVFAKSDTYGWENDNADVGFEKLTLFSRRDYSRQSDLKTAAKIVRFCRKLDADHVFVCNYERPAILFAAATLRILGKEVYAMGDSKFDDYERHLWREVGKSFFYLPYSGGFSNRARSTDYMRFLGVNSRKIVSPYNTLSLSKIRELAASAPAPEGMPFSERHFTIIARFVPKKNLSMALEGYAMYCQAADQPRKLHLCGSGELEPLLRAKVAELKLGEQVVFRGFVQRDGVAKVLGQTLALLLPSIEEQFGNVVIEAQAMGLPVILSDNCGARDTLVRSGVNGFVIEPDNPEGLAFFMGLLDRDEALWRRMCASASVYAEKGDVARFAEAVMTLVPPA